MTTTTLDITGAEIARPAWGRLLPALGGLGLVAGLIAHHGQPGQRRHGRDRPRGRHVCEVARDLERGDRALRHRLHRARRRVRRRPVRPPAGDRDPDRVRARPDRGHRLHAVLLALLDDLDGSAGRHAGRLGGRASRRRRRTCPTTTSAGSCSRMAGVAAAADGGSRLARGHPGRPARVARVARRRARGSPRSGRSRSSACSPGWRGSRSRRSRCCSDGGKRLRRASRVRDRLARSLFDPLQERRLAALRRGADDEEAQLVLVRGSRAGARFLAGRPGRFPSPARAAPARRPRPGGRSASRRGRRRPPPGSGRCGGARPSPAGSGRGSPASSSSRRRAWRRDAGRPRSAAASRARRRGRSCSPPAHHGGFSQARACATIVTWAGPSSDATRSLRRSRSSSPPTRGRALCCCRVTPGWGRRPCGGRASSRPTPKATPFSPPGRSKPRRSSPTPASATCSPPVHDAFDGAAGAAGACASGRAPARGAVERARSTSGPSRSASSASCAHSLRRGRCSSRWTTCNGSTERRLACCCSRRAGCRSTSTFSLALRSEARRVLPFSPEQVFPAYDELPVGRRARGRAHARRAGRLGITLPRPALQLRSRHGERESLLRPRARPRRGAEGRRGTASRPCESWSALASPRCPT